MACVDSTFCLAFLVRFDAVLRGVGVAFGVFAPLSFWFVCFLALVFFGLVSSDVVGGLVVFLLSDLVGEIA